MKKTDYFQIAKDKLKYLNYAPSTVGSYSFYIKQFVDSLGIPPSKIKTEHFQNYLDSFSFSSVSQQNQVISALKFFAEKILEVKYKIPKLDRPRREKHLPQVIDQETIKAKLAQIPNIKHKAILSLIYSAGLRVSEAINMKIEDIDSDRMQINIRQSKGNKDRVVKLSPYILDLLRVYFKKHRPKVYLFNGQNSLNYSATSCRKIMAKYISKDMKLHGLRHSNATHLIENGADISEVQKHLGHKSIQTTQIYVHISNNRLQSMPLPI